MKTLKLLILPLLLIACSPDNKEPYTISNIELGECTADAAKTVFYFLKWYRAHEENIAGGFVNNNGSSDTTKYYSVNFDSTKNYLAMLKNTGFVSDAYINTWREYFKKCDEGFKKNPESEGPPEGFDFDFIMQSQDFDDDLINVEKAKVQSGLIKNDSATLKVNFIYGNKLIYNLSKHANKWLIDGIVAWDEEKHDK